MQLPRVRYTVRSQMLAVAVTGLLLGGGIWVVDMSRRAATYRQKAAALGCRERDARAERWERLQLAATLDRQAESQARMPRLEESARNAARLAEHHRRLADRRGHEADDYVGLRRAYERAAAYPWLPAKPDPFRPEP